MKRTVTDRSERRKQSERWMEREGSWRRGGMERVVVREKVVVANWGGGGKVADMSSTK